MSVSFKLKVDIRDIVSLIRNLRQVPELWQQLAKVEAPDLGRTVMTVMRSEVRPVSYTGALERSISTWIDTRPLHFNIEVGPTAAHAKYVRYGTSPHWVPIAPLLRWAQWKLGDEKAAYAVRWSIHLHGTSRYAEMLYGTKENPYDIRTMERTETKQAIQRLQENLLRKLALKIVEIK